MGTEKKIGPREKVAIEFPVLWSIRGSTLFDSFMIYLFIHQILFSSWLSLAYICCHIIVVCLFWLPS